MPQAAPCPDHSRGQPDQPLGPSPAGRPYMRACVHGAIYLALDLSIYMHLSISGVLSTHHRQRGLGRRELQRLHSHLRDQRGLGSPTPTPTPNPNPNPTLTPTPTPTLNPNPSPNPIPNPNPSPDPDPDPDPSPSPSPSPSSNPDPNPNQIRWYGVLEELPFTPASAAKKGSIFGG